MANLRPLADDFFLFLFVVKKCDDRIIDNNAMTHFPETATAAVNDDHMGSPI